MSLRFLSFISDHSSRAAEKVFWPQGTVHELCNLGMWSKKAEREVLNAKQPYKLGINCLHFKRRRAKFAGVSNLPKGT